MQTLDQKNLSKTGKIAVARVVQAVDDLTIISTGGYVLRSKVADIVRSGRARRSELIFELQEGDKVASLARISAEDLRLVGATMEESG